MFDEHLAHQTKNNKTKTNQKTKQTNNTTHNNKQSTHNDIEIMKT
jgi:hypothetical protein